ncbi:MAG: hypothetical protein JW936_01530 [Sedimentisphaerales bacterium]|nr:hypothetical protein [Sedimentisphaerales bacterium]
MSRYLGQQFWAAGRSGLPEAFILDGVEYRLKRDFKHDFFAATAVYEPVLQGVGVDAVPLVLKLSRVGDFLGIPLTWLGRFLRDREYTILRHLQGVEGVARLVGVYGETGMLYEYVEGVSLDESPEIPDGFFGQLAELLDRIHARNVAYMDMNKRGNILLRPDGSPLMIDFQISCHVPERPWVGSRRFWRYLWRRLVAEDTYHLLKHKRRFRPDLMDESEMSASRRVSIFIELHRIFTAPLRFIRRKCMSFLGRTKVLQTDSSHNRSPENDPTRWAS